MRALVLEKKGELSLREIDAAARLSDRTTSRSRIHTVGVCGSDVHYYTHGAIGRYVVQGADGARPRGRGHGRRGRRQRHRSQGRRPGLHGAGHPGPDLARHEARHLQCRSRASPSGRRRRCTAACALRRPPGRLHLQAAGQRLLRRRRDGRALRRRHAGGAQARIVPGDVAVVIGAGPIGIMVALAALAGGCSKVHHLRPPAPKLEIAGRYPGIVPVNVGEQIAGRRGRCGDRRLGRRHRVRGERQPEGLRRHVRRCVRPGGAVVLVGMPVEPVRVRRVRRRSPRRCASRRCSATPTSSTARSQLIASGKVDLKPLITGTYRLRRQHRGLRARGPRPAGRRQAADPAHRLGGLIMSAIVCSHVDKTYGAVNVIRRVRSRRSRSHEFVVFLGPVGLRQVDLAAHDRRAWRTSPAASCRIGGKVVNDLRARASATSPWCSRTTRSIRT